jgi:hypothetical protein
MHAYFDSSKRFSATGAVAATSSHVAHTLRAVRRETS